MDKMEEGHKKHEINELLEVIVARIASNINPEYTIVYIYDAEEQLLYNRQVDDVIEAMELQFNLGKGLVGRVLEQGKTIVIGDVQASEDFDSACDKVIPGEMHSVLLVPLITTDGNKVGVIELVNKKEGFFDKKDVAFLEAMCAQAAIAIDNTLLVAELTVARSRESKLHDELLQNNEKLQRSYIDLEEKNSRIEQTAIRIKKIRSTAIITVSVIILVVVYFAWPSSVSSNSEEHVVSTAPKYDPKLEGQYELFTVAKKPIVLKNTFSGVLQPSQIVNMFAPFKGIVKEVDFEFGGAVDKGQKLLVLDAEEQMANYRTVQIDEMKKRQELFRVKDWEHSVEMTQARRKMDKVKEQVNLAKDELQQSELLYEKGVVSRRDFDAAKRKVKESEESIVSEVEALVAVKEKGNDQAILFADYEWQNAKMKERQLKEKLDQYILYSPVPGVAIKPPESNSSKGVSSSKQVEVGMSLDENAIFVAIGDLTKLSVVSEVDEIDINNITLGQDVEITGDAFKGIILHGKITYVSSEAKSSGRKPSFTIKVITEEITPAQREKIRLGMSATLAIATYTNPDALMVPLRAVQNTREGKFVHVIKEGQKEPVRTAVETGVTTIDSIEVTQGLVAGEKLMIL